MYNQTFINVRENVPLGYGAKSIIDVDFSHYNGEGCVKRRYKAVSQSSIGRLQQLGKRPLIEISAKGGIILSFVFSR